MLPARRRLLTYNNCGKHSRPDTLVKSRLRCQSNLNRMEWDAVCQSAWNITLVWWQVIVQSHHGEAWGEVTEEEKHKGGFIRGEEQGRDHL